MILAPTLTLSAGSGAAIVRPTFSRDFAGEKTLNNGTGPAITFTRASNATFFNASGVLQTASNDQPRFDHDPATGASRGLLIEEARTNLLERSAEFDNIAYAASEVTITADAVTSPDGSQTADKIIPTTTNSDQHWVNQGVVTIGQTYTVSIFAKAAEYSFLFIRGLGLGGSGGARFNLSNGTVEGVNGYSSATIQSVGNGWYRCIAVGTAGSTNGAFYNVSNTASYTSFAGDGTSGIFIWGAQLEAGAFPTSYIPTTTAAATRSADSAVVTPISSFYNQAEGTLFAEAVVLARNANIANISEDNSENNRLTLYTATARTMRWFINSNNVIEYNSESAAITSGANGRIAGAYKTNDVIAATNGVLSAADTSIVLPPVALTHFFIGRTATSFGPPYNGHIRKIAYYPRRLSNTLLQQLTT